VRKRRRAREKMISFGLVPRWSGQLCEKVVAFVIILGVAFLAPNVRPRSQGRVGNAMIFAMIAAIVIATMIAFRSF